MYAHDSVIGIYGIHFLQYVGVVTRWHPFGWYPSEITTMTGNESWEENLGGFSENKVLPKFDVLS